MANEKNFMMQFDGPLPPGLEALPNLEVEITKDIAEKLAEALGGGGGGADLGELVMVKASESLEDFGFEVWIGDRIVVPSYADTEGTTVAAGASVYISVTDESKTGTYAIGSAEPVAMEFFSVGITAYRWFTIPVDTPALTVVTVDGQF